MLILALLTSTGFLALLGYGIYRYLKARRYKEKAARISKEIINYFRKTGVDVIVVSTNLKGDERFTALIESEPMKRFRLSHIIEYKMRDHIHKTCGLELECIYWRFPVKVTTQHVFPATADDPETIIPATAIDVERKAGSSDSYITEGLVPYKDVPKIEVTELDWETYEEAAVQDADNSDKKTNSEE